MKAAERYLQYLYHTRKEALEFHRHGDAKEITGWAYQIGNGTVAWKCKAQAIVALSSCEAELIAIDDAVRELRFLHK